MANEITLTASFRCTNGYYDVVRQVAAAQFTQTGLGAGGGPIVNVGTTAEAITLTDITTPGYCFMRNLGPTNFVTIGDIDAGVAGAFVPVIKLKVGEFAMFRLGLDSSSLGAKADTGAIDLEVIVLED